MNKGRRIAPPIAQCRTFQIWCASNWVYWFSHLNLHPSVMTSMIISKNNLYFHFSQKCDLNPTDTDRKQIKHPRVFPSPPKAKLRFEFGDKAEVYRKIVNVNKWLPLASVSLA